MEPIPLNILTLYADLAQQVETAAADEATPVETVVKGVRYLRLQRWVGASRTIEHLGRVDDPAAMARARRAASEMARRAERRKLVSTMRRLMPGPPAALGKVLDATAAAGLFRRGAVLVGTGAYQCYPPLVGYVLPAAALMTQDADLATADLALAPDSRGDSIETILRRADPSFSAVPGLDPRSPPCRFRSRAGFMVDLLTPRRRRSDPQPVPLRGLAAGAAPMQQLEWLIAEPVGAVALHGAGVAIRVPQPARFAVHKLIVAQKRPANDLAKRRKDLLQAQALFMALAEVAGDALQDALEDAMNRGRAGWRRPIEQSLAEIERGAWR